MSADNHTVKHYKSKRGDSRHSPHFDIVQVPKFISELNKASITLEDVKNAVKVFDTVADCLCNLKMHLHVTQCKTFNFPQFDVSSHEKDQETVNILENVRTVAIALLNSNKRKVVTAAKRKSPKNNIFMMPVKVAKSESKPSILEASLTTQSQPQSPKLLDICYICRKSSNLQERHPFHQWMCVSCGDFNFKKRNQTGNLSGKTALVTGGRVKIGFQTALKLLRAGVDRLIVTTRFPADALKRYETEADFMSWSHRLHIYQLDLRFLQHVQHFCEYIRKTYPKLDILIQNAAQTIRRPSAYYRTLIDGELQCFADNTGIIQSWNTDTQLRIKSPSLPVAFPSLCEDTDIKLIDGKEQHPSEHLIHPEDFKYAVNKLQSKIDFPPGEVDDDGQQLDLRRENSWILSLDHVKTAEMVEVTVVNYMAPYTILQKLTPLMRRTGSEFESWIILVTAMEGKFMDCYKTSKHPHTNGAKAGLNMLVRTCAQEYKKMGLLLNAVDTGWVTEEHPHGHFQASNKPPLDSVDGAARVLDPIFQNINSGVVICGRFIKDYLPTSW